MTATFSDQLKLHRRALQMTQEDFASLLDLRMRTYIKYEQGLVVPKSIAQEGAIARIVKAYEKKEAES